LPFTWTIAVRAIVLGSGFALLALGCGPGTGFGPGNARASFGIVEADETAFEDPEVATRALAFLRARLAGGDAPPADLADLEGRRVFVHLFEPGRPERSVTALGGTFAESLARAARQLLDDRGGVLSPAADWRIRLAVATGHETGRMGPGEVWRPRKIAIGVRGLWIEDRDGRSAWLTGAEIVQQGLWKGRKEMRGIPKDALLRALSKRVDGAVDRVGRFAWLSTADWTDPPGGGAALRVRRGYVEFERGLDVDLLERRALHAADYLSRIIDADGKYMYRYNAVQDRPGTGYNLLRHAGSTWSLLQAYQRFGDPAHLAAAERAIEWFLATCQLRSEEGPWGSDFRFCEYQKFAKLGANGLGLLMLTEYMEATGTRTYLQVAQELGRFTRRMQEENGHFFSYYDWGDGAKVPDKEVIYYPGESCFGLMKLYRLDENPLWLDIVERGVDYMIFKRDRGKGELLIPHDHWLMYALVHLYGARPEEHFLERGELILRSIVARQFEADESVAEDYPLTLGGYYRPPHFTPGGTRGEAMVAGIDLLTLAGSDPAWLFEPAMVGLEFSTGAQYNPVTSYFLPNPSRAAGGIGEGLVATWVRNDFVQHNLSALLGMERHLRAKEGVELPGGPEWMGPARTPTPEDLERWHGWRVEWQAGPTVDWSTETAGGEGSDTAAGDPGLALPTAPPAVPEPSAPPPPPSNPAPPAAP
jgi:hypothetical protein